MEKIKTLGKPIVTLIVAGRNVLIDDYIGDWDAAVMCYLPGTEGDGVISPLVGACEFTGKLPMPWYKSEEDIGKQNADLLFELGYGLTY
jgi:beta-glucosidase